MLGPLTHNLLFVYDIKGSMANLQNIMEGQSCKEMQ